MTVTMLVAVAVILALAVSAWLDRTRHHVCKPPEAYWNDDPGMWLTRTPVGSSFLCRCGARWGTVSYAGSTWRRWVRR